MILSAAELKHHLGKYLETARGEDIIIKRHKEIICVITTPQRMQEQIEKATEKKRERAKRCYELTCEYLTNLSALLERE